MEIKVTRKFANADMEIVIEEKDDDEAMAKALVFTEQDYCTNCKNTTGIKWQANKASTDKGTFTYIKRFCPSCMATSTLGKYKTGGYFWKKFEVYNPDRKDEFANITTVKHKQTINPKNLPF